MGRIGYALARRAHLGFDMNIQYYNRSQNLDAEQHLSATRKSLNEVLANSDFICVMVPLTEDTTGLIGENEFKLMKKSAIFVNGSRGKVVDEAALIEALTNKTIYAAGLDVFEIEPLPSDSPLCQLDNAVIFPHIGSATTETRLKMAICAVDNLIAALNSDLTNNCANLLLLKPIS
jgi:gluconate 2-dehydrogenase